MKGDEEVGVRGPQSEVCGYMCGCSKWGVGVIKNGQRKG